MGRTKVDCCNDCAKCELALKPEPNFDIKVCILDQLLQRANTIISNQSVIIRRIEVLESVVMDQIDTTSPEDQETNQS